MSHAEVLAKLDPAQCVQCKAARALCGISPCPLLQTARESMPTIRHASNQFAGTAPPSIFVGRYGYPKVNLGPMLTGTPVAPAIGAELENPAGWMDTHQIAQVVGLRSSLVRTTHHIDVGQAMDPTRIASVAQELAMAPRQIDTEVKLDRVPMGSLGHVSQFTMPHGPSANVLQAELTENLAPVTGLQRAFDDTDLRVADAMAELRRDASNYQLEQVLSAGLLGEGARRKFVPTRWAITATDDQLGNAILDRIRDFGTIDVPLGFSGGGFGNEFVVILLPGPWGFDYLEGWAKGSFWAQGGAGADVGPIGLNDWEGPEGRRDYANNTKGGYYAARLPVLEWMEAHRVQATAIVVRAITDAYTTPLGVWVVREAARRTMVGSGLTFENHESAFHHLTRRTKLKQWRAQMGYLDRFLEQTRLDSFR